LLSIAGRVPAPLNIRKENDVPAKPVPPVASRLTRQSAGANNIVLLVMRLRLSLRLKGVGVDSGGQQLPRDSTLDATSASGRVPGYLPVRIGGVTTDSGTFIKAF